MNPHPGGKNQYGDSGLDETESRMAIWERVGLGRFWVVGKGEERPLVMKHGKAASKGGLSPRQISKP